MRCALIVLLLTAVASSEEPQTRSGEPAAGGVGEVATETVAYSDGELPLEGFLAYPRSVPSGRKLPGVLVVHEWYGLNDYARDRARQLADQLGVVAFAVDMYGRGKRAQNDRSARELSKPFRESPTLARRRVRAGLEVLREQKLVDSNRIAAIGYCFGGSVVLELARGGADVAGVVSFHGGLGTSMPAERGQIKAEILVLHGANDPHVGWSEVSDFVHEMKKSEAQWQLVVYGQAVHAFTNPANDADPWDGVAYDEQADRRSWAAMVLFFHEVLGTGQSAEPLEAEAEPDDRTP